MAFHRTKLNKADVEKYFFKLCVAVAEMRSPKEVAEFIRDLLSYQETEMIAKRLIIAEMILANQTYEEIRKILKVSNGTIARVQGWLKLSGEGYRRAVDLTKKRKAEPQEQIEKFSEWNSVKKRYSLYFWPQLLLEELVRNSNKRQRKHITNVMKEIERSKDKSELFKRVNEILISEKGSL